MRTHLPCRKSSMRKNRMREFCGRLIAAVFLWNVVHAALPSSETIKAWEEELSEYAPVNLPGCRLTR